MGLAVSCQAGTGALGELVEPPAVAALCGKRIVALGELPSHGEAGGFAIKAELVQALVQQCGFDALLFEAPMYDFVGFNRALADGSASQMQLDNAIGRFWWTRELAGWRLWLFEMSAGQQLLIGGLDDQVGVTSVYAIATLPALVAASAREEACGEAVERNLQWRYDDEHVLDADQRRQLLRCALRSRDAAEASEAAEQRMLENLATYYQRELDELDELDELGPTRDKVMYQNVRWHLGQMPEGAKVIIWTANVHAARSAGGLPHRSMGAMLADAFGAEFAAVGVTAGGGWSRTAGGASMPLEQAPSGSLEHQGRGQAGGAIYLDSEQLQTAGTIRSRLLGHFARARWDRYFDGVIVVRDETAPTPDWPQ